jgi:hypothetical protein
VDRTDEVASDALPTLDLVNGDALRELITCGRRIKPGYVFVPCTLCLVPVDSAGMPLNGQFCASCALASYGHSSN